MDACRRLIRPLSDHCPFCRDRNSETPPPVASLSIRPADLTPGRLAIARRAQPLPGLVSPRRSVADVRRSAQPGHPSPGWHEVVIESPEAPAAADRADCRIEVVLVLQAYRDRFRVFANDPSMHLRDRLQELRP